MSGREVMIGDKPLSSLRVVDLKEELEKRGLSKSGTKKDLVDRLKAKLLLDKGKEEAAEKIDEEKLPNIAEKLPDDPFVREYLASQAELFHSQQVAKKLYREEQMRESEGSGASADEREKSPLKSPSKIADSLSPVRQQTEEPTALTSIREAEREKSPERRTRGRPPSSSKSQVRTMPGTRHEEVPVIPEEVEAPPLKSPSKEVQPISLLKHQAEEKVEPITIRATEREKSPEKRSTRGRPARSKSPVRVEEEEVTEAAVIPEVVEEAVPPKSPSEVVDSTSPIKPQATPEEERKEEVTSKGDTGRKESLEAEVTSMTRAAEEREKSPEKRSTRGRPARSKSPVHLEEEEVKQDKAAVIPEEEEVAPPKSPPKVASPVKLQAGEEMTSKSGSEREKSPDKEVTSTSRPIEEEREKSPDKEVTSASRPMEEEREKSPEKRTTRGRPGRSNSPVPMGEKPQEDQSPIIPEKEDGLPPAKSPTKIVKVPEEVKAASAVIEVVEKPVSEKRKEVEVPIIQPQSPPAKRSKIRVAVAEVPVEIPEKPIVKTRTKIVPIEFNESDLGVKVVEKERPKGKARSTTTVRLEKSKDEASAEGTTGRRNSTTAMEKESLLDEVLDYGEESVDMAEFDEPATSAAVKKPSVPEPIPTKSRPPKEEPESPPVEEVYEPIEFERRVIKIKPNKHSQRRKEQFEEDQKEREKKRSRLPLVVTTQLMKAWYPDVVMLTTEELKMIDEHPPSTPPSELERKLQITRTISNVESVDIENMAGGVGEGGDSGGEEEETPQQEMDLSIQRKISIISMDEEVTKGQTPPRRAPTQLILVTNLVRPFTIPQLKELLQRTGNVLDLWVDKIKSKCVAKYDTEDEAIETRTALHGVKWPSSNPKSLSVDFTTEERVDDLRRKDSGYVEEKQTASQHVREWDVGKNSPPKGQRKRSRSRDKEDRDRDRDRKRSRRSSSPGHARRRTRSPHSDRNGDVKKSEASGKTLDELFRKTVATPCIYWLPLNPQQIAEKEELRRKRMEERERRITEMQHHHRAQR